MSSTPAARGNTLKDVPTAVAVAQIKHFGDAIVLPDGMELDEAIDTIFRRKKYLEEEMVVTETFGFFPLDGAHALNKVLEAKFGWSCAEPTPGMFGNNPPRLINIEVAPREFKQVPWGRFSIPNMEDAFLQCSVNMEKGSLKFQLVASIKRKYEGQISALFALVRAELEAESIYRGKAVKIRFKDDQGNMLEMPTPEFMDLSDVDEAMLIYSEEVQRSITTNLFTPILRVRDCIANNIPVKRGVMLAGTYGTGKTLGAKVAAKLSVQTGNTFIYIPHADELSLAVEMAKQYQSPACTISCEDVDRATSGERTVEMDDILNIIDGIDTKTANIITVLTSNDIESINPALLRPGRLDAVIHVTAPDKDAVIRLLRAYGGAAIAATTNLDAAAETLKGNIPAVIAEVVKRAKLAELARTPVGGKVTNLSEAAILEAAQSVRAHVDLLERRSAQGVDKLPSFEALLVEAMRESIGIKSSRLARVGDAVTPTVA